MSSKEQSKQIDDHLASVPELPQRVLSSYARLWQFETWLRRMVYVELKSRDGDSWGQSFGRSEHPRNSDKRFTHMPTPEDDPLSFGQFSDLQKAISQHWNLFLAYLPPKEIWEVKLQEVTQIRHRVAHFRRGHFDDLQRILQILRDIDRGFWTFCTSYNDPDPVLPASKDPVTEQFAKYDPFPYTEVEKGKWARVGIADPSMICSATVDVLRRPWAELVQPVCGTAGYLYDVRIAAREMRTYNYRQFLDQTKDFHSHVVHLCLDSLASAVRLTLPAVLGEQRIVSIIQRAMEVATNTVRRRPMAQMNGTSVQQFSDECPEFVLGPDNPLTYLDPDMPCTFFNA